MSGNPPNKQCTHLIYRNIPVNLVDWILEKCKKIQFKTWFFCCYGQCFEKCKNTLLIKFIKMIYKGSQVYIFRWLILKYFFSFSSFPSTSCFIFNVCKIQFVHSCPGRTANFPWEKTTHQPNQPHILNFGEGPMLFAFYRIPILL